MEKNADILKLPLAKLVAGSMLLTALGGGVLTIGTLYGEMRRDAVTIDHRITVVENTHEKLMTLILKMSQDITEIKADMRSQRPPVATTK